MIDGDTTYLHLHNFCMELKEREIFYSPLRLCLSPQDFGPTDLTSTYTVRTRRHRASYPGLPVWSLML
ncbi:hypothetical protein TNCV_5006221 [Trichonephila clavipes]|uniref:Uncharacterized protein n=1 Tax=Trichonephila clavipes TaxID=2585209 RepID=A0A8X6VIN6_TRICX|nr:hypothetical protein TNCV_5006221 [Trichonephila clavipes]